MLRVEAQHPNIMSQTILNVKYLKKIIKISVYLLTKRTFVLKIIVVLLNIGSCERENLMENISEKVISLEEARTALRCMRLGGLNEEEALECLDSVSERVRKVTLAGLVESIIENNLSDVQREYIKKYWYEQKSTAQIARECGVSQAGVYRTIERANQIIKELMTPVINYHRDLISSDIEPVVLEDSFEICAARKRFGSSLCEALRDMRVSRGIDCKTFANALKISVKELEEIEDGHRIPSIITAMRYSALFGIEIKMTFINGRGNYEWKKA